MNKIIIILCIIPMIILLNSCTEKVNYTKEQCINLKKGDTIYFSTYFLEKGLVVNNNPELEIIEIQNVKYEWDVDILYYDDFRFK